MGRKRKRLKRLAKQLDEKVTPIGFALRFAFMA